MKTTLCLFVRSEPTRLRHHLLLANHTNTNCWFFFVFFEDHIPNQSAHRAHVFSLKGTQFTDQQVSRCKNFTLKHVVVPCTLILKFQSQNSKQQMAILVVSIRSDLTFISLVSVMFLHVRLFFWLKVRKVASPRQRTSAQPDETFQPAVNTVYSYHNISARCPLLCFHNVTTTSV